MIREGAEKFFLDEVVQQQSEDCGGKEADEDGHGELQPFGILAADALHHLQDVLPVKPEDGEDRAAPDADRETVGGEFIGLRGGADAHEALGDDEVAGGGDREVFGDAIDEAEEDGLPDFHKFSAGCWMRKWRRAKTGDGEKCRVSGEQWEESGFRVHSLNFSFPIPNGPFPDY